MEKENNREEKKKGFFAKLFEALDKKLEAKAKKIGSCCGSLKENKDSDGPNTDQLKHSGDWGRPNCHSGKKIESLDGDSCCG